MKGLPQIKERWLPAFHRTGFSVEGLHYEVSNIGRVRNLKTKRIFAGRLNKSGYRVVDLLGKTFNLHRVVMLTFRPAMQACEVDHRNHVRSDARLRNLQWMTHLDNIRKARRNRQKKAA